jgi:hypothetical protein
MMKNPNPETLNMVREYAQMNEMLAERMITFCEGDSRPPVALCREQGRIEKQQRILKRLVGKATYDKTSNYVWDEALGTNYSKRLERL